jgi:hypothetical protein
METVLAADEAPAPGPNPIMLELRDTLEAITLPRNVGAYTLPLATIESRVFVKRSVFEVVFPTDTAPPSEIETLAAEIFVSCEPSPVKYAADTFPATTRTFEPVLYANRFDPTVKVLVDTVAFPIETFPVTVMVFEPMRFPKRFAPEILLARADTWPIRVVPEIVEALTVFEPARDP